MVYYAAYDILDFYERRRRLWPLVVYYADTKRCLPERSGCLQQLAFWTRGCLVFYELRFSDNRNR